MVIIRPVSSEQEVERAIETYWANDPPENSADKMLALAHWFVIYASCPEGFWIAEDEVTRQIVGVASAVRRPPQWLLPNFYVLPAYHGQHIGRRLLSQVFAVQEGCDRFAVHASLNPSAQSLYMQFGMYPLPYSIQFRGNPQNKIILPSAVTAEEHPAAEILATLNTFDQKILGFARPMDHQRWAEQGNYFLLKAEEQIVGYFRVSSEGRIGPLVVSDDSWMNAALNCAVYQQGQISADAHDILVPGANRSALAYLLAHGYRYLYPDLLLSSHHMPGLEHVLFHDMDFL